MTDAGRQASIRSALSDFATARRIPLAEVSEVWRERAAIREYLGGLRHRRNAELHGVANTFRDVHKEERLSDDKRKLDPTHMLYGHTDNVLWFNRHSVEVELDQARRELKLHAMAAGAVL